MMSQINKGVHDTPSFRKKAELLAPAGSPEAFKGALNAGADAIYLGCTKYGARAYAENFSPDQVILALNLAHFYGVRVYLTVNTLMLQGEIDDLKDFLMPFYKEGLDGVIVQDLGALSLIKREFPELPIHASTQMSISTPEGARFMQDLGVSRVVPSRELSLEEVRSICDTGIEVEAFIHGAMCYSYSGRCLMSSLIGGRSGNRGRCAQPCRLKYSVDGCKGGCDHPLSLKDMCTVDMIPQLIESNITSFKIEGRMKKPEYAAGVTSVYRKAIDEYYQAGHIADADKYFGALRSLYIRTNTGTGYYINNPGPDMLTGDSPGYEGADEKLLMSIRDDYIKDTPRLKASMKAVFKKYEPIKINMECSGISAVYEGQEVLKAKNNPVSAESLNSYLGALGDSQFELTDLVIDMDDDAFLPVGAIKAARREAVKLLEGSLLSGFKRELPSDKTMADNKLNDRSANKANGKSFTMDRSDGRFYSIYADSCEQLKAVMEHRILDKVKRVYLPFVLLRENPDAAEFLRSRGVSVIGAFPQVSRQGSFNKDMLRTECLDGLFVRDIDSLAYALQFSKYNSDKIYEPDKGSSFDAKIQIIADSSLYVWNNESRGFIESLGVLPSVSLEQSKEQLKDFNTKGMELMVYGRIPLMVSANCVALSSGTCKKQGSSKPGYISMKDRKGAVLPVKRECGPCYNVILSEKPLSLHEYSRSVAKAMPGYLKISFSNESYDETVNVLSLYEDLFCINNHRIEALGIKGNNSDCGFEYFTGAYKKAVE